MTTLLPLPSRIPSVTAPPAAAQHADDVRGVRAIDEVSVTRTAATAKATLFHGPTHFTDDFVPLKVNGEWKIANKVYHAAPRAP